MKHLTPSQHALQRMNLRGIHPDDIDLIMELGESDADERRVTLTRQTASAEIGRLKKRIAQVDRLSGKTLIVDLGLLITPFHDDGRAERKRRGNVKRQRRRRGP